MVVYKIPTSSELAQMKAVKISDFLFTMRDKKKRIRKASSIWIDID